MMGLFALVVNYGLFGWIIPGFFNEKDCFQSIYYLLNNFKK